MGLLTRLKRKRSKRTTARRPGPNLVLPPDDVFTRFHESELKLCRTQVTTASPLNPSKESVNADADADRYADLDNVPTAKSMSEKSTQSTCSTARLYSEKEKAFAVKNTSQKSGSERLKKGLLKVSRVVTSCVGRNAKKDVIHVDENEKKIKLVRDLEDSVREVHKEAENKTETSQTIAPLRPPPPPPGFAPVSGGPPAPIGLGIGGGCPPPPPPPPPPMLLKGPLTVRRAPSKNAVKYEKNVQTVNCRFDAIDDNKSKRTLYDKVISCRLPNLMIKSINEAFVKREHSVHQVRSTVDCKKTAPLMAQHKKLGLNIVLHKNKITPYELCRRIVQHPHPDLDFEVLDGILKNFPSDEEMKLYEQVKDADSDALDVVDKFLLKIVRAPELKFLMEMNLYRSDITLNVMRLTHSIECLLSAVRGVQNHCAELEILLHWILQTGNYLNQGSALFGAAGFAFTDVHRIMLMTGSVEESIIDMMMACLGSEFVLQMEKLQALKTITAEASKQNLEETEKVLLQDLDTLKKLNERLDIATLVTDEFKSKVVKDLTTLEGLINGQKEQIELVKKEARDLFLLLVYPQNKTLDEFMTYLDSVVVIIGKALMKKKIYDSRQEKKQSYGTSCSSRDTRERRAKQESSVRETTSTANYGMELLSKLKSIRKAQIGDDDDGMC